MTAEPPEGLQGIVHLRIKLPDGTRLSRRFYGNQLMEVRCAIFGVAGVMLCLTQELHAFVGAQNPVNPRHFRLLASDTATTTGKNRDIDCIWLGRICFDYSRKC